ncbi:nicotinate-nucleotide--dimethylbenzimidazole phosphoribosyltransferase [Brevibacillus migulae]|uniref:nicotinate-nucleotide--dimethylbenzimidazole phosphoribosyltransferase n=1 Tax=Brevibacillus migulae TaxID=1644114 RepID=UPI00106E6D41|nr:nicotinate-nucleotide--dimethylbenzimidazole phosphoribosyltransferase [Brevibacillus migulae]
MSEYSAVARGIPALDTEAAEKARRHIDQLTKPPGSLGRLEELAIRLAGMTGEPFPQISPPGILVFAGDHGVVEEGVSAFPQEVTAQMVMNFASGGAAINVFARHIGGLLRVVDVGVISDPEAPDIWRKKVRPGTGNMLREDAMTRAEAERCLAVGIESAETIIGEGARLLIIGEMGIGNTTSSSAILAAFTGADPEEIVGRGTGVAEDAFAHKKKVVKQALEARRPNAADAIDVLAKVGGLEIGAMAGAVIGAASRRIPVLADGFISSVAALLAVRIEPQVRDYLLFGHQSQEPGHARVLAELAAEPILDLQLRLGEGSGAAVAFPILEAAVRMVREMATFSSAGISEKRE